MTPLTVAGLTVVAVLAGMWAGAVLVGRPRPRWFKPLPVVIDLSHYYPRRLDKDEAECCKAHALPDGRPVIGYCGPDCERRPS